jgi:hypothetical protein
MHPYTADVPDRRIAPITIGAIAIFMALGLSRLLGIVNVSPPWWIDTPSVLGFYWPLWRIYDRWGWKWRLGPFALSVIRDFSGSWSGVVTSSYQGESPMLDSPEDVCAGQVGPNIQLLPYPLVRLNGRC